MVRYPSIEQYRGVVKLVTERACYVGKDEDGKAIFDFLKPKPKLTFTASEKIHGCFDKDTLVTLANGENVKISELTPGSYVLTYNIDSGEQEPKQVKNVINQNLDKSWLRVTFDGATILCTEDHKIYTKNRGYVEARNLKDTDIFVTL